MITSSFFSLLTVLTYLVLKEKRNIHGWTVISYATSMFFMYVFLGGAHLIRYYWSNDVLKTKACVTIGKTNLTVHSYLKAEHFKLGLFDNPTRHCDSSIFLGVIFVADHDEWEFVVYISVRVKFNETETTESTMDRILKSLWNEVS
jgi:hypothetical protein